MGFLPDFENDVFISYAHIDNQPITEGQKGWISNFHQTLEILLRQRLGSQPKIWRDAKLQGNDYFADTLVGHLPRVAILVSVLSPGYLKSEWCMREMREFCKAAEKTRGIRIVDKARIFKVVKTYVPLEKHPPELNGLLGYEFFQIDPTTSRPREFSHDLNSTAQRNYLQKLDDLAYDIYQLLETLNSSGKQSVPHTGTTIYLADTTSDLGPARDKIKRELQQRGHYILPDKPLPLNATDVKEVIRENLQRSKLSIHLIGENYGIIPEAESRSVVYLQNELAAERSSADGFSRLIWIPVELKTVEERQREFIEFLENDSSAQKGAELLRTTLEELKTVIEDKLNDRKKPAPPPPSSPDGPLRVYMICDTQDFEATRPLEDFFYNQGIELITPVMEGDEAQVRQDHIENLKLCDAVVIYYGAAGELWLRAKLRDLQKLPGYGRSEPLLAKAIYVAAPETQQKLRLRTHEAMMIKNFGEFSPESLKPFLAQIEEVKGGWRR